MFVFNKNKSSDNCGALWDYLFIVTYLVVGLRFIVLYAWVPLMFLYLISCHYENTFLNNSILINVSFEWARMKVGEISKYWSFCRKWKLKSKNLLKLFWRSRSQTKLLTDTCLNIYVYLFVLISSNLQLWLTSADVEHSKNMKRK